MPDQFLDYEKSLACIHCGLCLSSCPTYLEAGNENDSPRGRIYIMRAIQDGRLPLADAAVRHIDLCLGCRACEVACPSGVPYGELLEATREHIQRQHRRSFIQRVLRKLIIEKVFPYPARLRLLLAPALLAKRLRLHNLLPRFAREGLSLLPPRLDVDTAPEFAPARTGLKRGRVGFIRGCVMRLLFGETNRASVQLLNQAGYDVVTPAAQACCGALYAHNGNLERARQCARRNIEAFDALGLEAIVINAAGCGSTLKEYGHLLAGDARWADRARRFSAKIKDLTEFLAPATASPADARVGGVTYHDACHLAHPQRITAPPRQLIRAAAGETFVELLESDVCCGSAGSYNLTEPAMAERLQKRKVDRILQSGAKVVVTTNPGCILQIRAGLAKAGVSDVEVLHIADFLVRFGERQSTT